MTSILIADDQELLAQLLKNSLTERFGYDISLVTTYPELMARMDQNARHDLALVNYHMPGQNGITGLKEVVMRMAGNPVAVLSDALPRHVLVNLPDHGVSGYLPKSMSLKSIFAAVEFLLAGEKYFPLSAMHQISGRNICGFTERQMEVLSFIISGLNNREIANRLGLLEAEVSRAAKKVLTALGARNRVQAAVIALNKGYAGCVGHDG